MLLFVAQVGGTTFQIVEKYVRCNLTGGTNGRICIEVWLRLQIHFDRERRIPNLLTVARGDA